MDDFTINIINDKQITQLFNLEKELRNQENIEGGECVIRIIYSCQTSSQFDRPLHMNGKAYFPKGYMQQKFGSGNLMAEIPLNEVIDFSQKWEMECFPQQTVELLFITRKN